jgi:hypothetical protein
MLFICSSDLSLYFQALTVRHEQIPEAHRNTIEWRDDNAADFHEWLASGELADKGLQQPLCFGVS